MNSVETDQPSDRFLFSHSSSAFFLRNNIFLPREMPLKAVWLPEDVSHCSPSWRRRSRRWSVDAALTVNGSNGWTASRYTLSSRCFCLRTTPIVFSRENPCQMLVWIKKHTHTHPSPHDLRHIVRLSSLLTKRSPCCPCAWATLFFAAWWIPCDPRGSFHGRMAGKMKEPTARESPRRRCRGRCFYERSLRRERASYRRRWTLLTCVTAYCVPVHMWYYIS